jgi:hypothetical protein
MIAIQSTATVIGTAKAAAELFASPRDSACAGEVVAGDA